MLPSLLDSYQMAVVVAPGGQTHRKASKYDLVVPYRARAALNILCRAVVARWGSLATFSSLVSQRVFGIFGHQYRAGAVPVPIRPGTGREWQRLLFPELCQLLRQR